MSQIFREIGGQGRIVQSYISSFLSAIDRSGRAGQSATQGDLLSPTYFRIKFTYPNLGIYNPLMDSELCLSGKEGLLHIKRL